MNYTLRIILTSLALTLITGVLIWRGPQIPDVRLIAYGPNGDAVSSSTEVSLTFSRAVDRQSAEALFRIEPAVEGSFFWQDNTLTFRPITPLTANTNYRIAVAAGLNDLQGSQNRQDIAWEFQTRDLQLLVIHTANDGGSIVSAVSPEFDGHLNCYCACR